MPRFRCMKPIFDLPLTPILRYTCRLRLTSNLLRVSYSNFIASPTRWSQQRAFSNLTQYPTDLFENTTANYNNELRHKERRRIFNVDELSRLAAESVNRSPNDVASLVKLAEGGFNRVFLISMHDGFRMIARIPYPIMDPKYFAIASEVATMDYLRSVGIPIPEVYGYSPIPDNAAGTEYIFMEYVQGTNLGDIWFDLEETDIISITRQLAQLESKMMSISFPAGGSLYYTKDLKDVPESESGNTRLGITLEKDTRFCVGPDTSIPLWFGRRSQLIVDRGPYKNIEETLRRRAEKEIAYLERFGKPLLPFERMRREAYNYEKQSPMDYIENIKRYLSIAPSIIPRDPALRHFRIRHPDLIPTNVIVSRSSDTDLHIVNLIDWQKTSILPLFLLAGIPQEIQNYNDSGWKTKERPSIPEDLANLDEAQQSKQMELYRRRLVHYHYVGNTWKYNKPHYSALADPMDGLRRRLFEYSGGLWEGETLELKVALIEAMKRWETLTGGGLPCPIAFETDDIEKTMKLYAEQERADRIMENIRRSIGCPPDGRVTVDRYDMAMEFCKELKEGVFAAAELEGELAQIATHWVLDDMDEEEYM